ncbi:D-erythritol 1-phosphate dehydrogenase [Methylobacterium gregans]|uniref:Glycerol-3-phosphate dehydrogenase n=2 Tax=Methylobacterium gregans TaxID=374424 RepID=A0AA37HT97_9HYPH|nr:glycerol-3-phosphate dehydrogenase [Methylobacterium gregans]MDQ0523670.1 glycerol-3-phosphate dehydrogenase [Methylobacterium gregans]GJD81717.1 D-erythritol 1-phosphate dehydrogenase [Methylobacterium gregans]
MRTFDVAVIGGGINGCGIARDAAGRGYSVALAEQNDLGSGTSSWSTKLIHGGLRYLEHSEFRLVREALAEREVLWGIAPHIVRPLRFVLPLHAGLRPAWLLRAGLFLYDHLGGRKRLPATRPVDLSGPLGAPLKPVFRRGFEYSDARVDDTRLVVLNARDAQARGAEIAVRTRIVSARREGGLWRIVRRDFESGREEEIAARFLVNAAGPWVDRVIQGPLGRHEARHVRLVQGSHIVVRKLYDHDRAFIFQNADGRIIFAIPYANGTTLVGTTDRDFSGDPDDAVITGEETEYLLRAASEYFAEPLRREDIVWSFSGVRPLFDDHASTAQEATRDYVLKTEAAAGEAAVLNIFGGKITTYRKLAEDALAEIGRHLGARGRSWTGTAPLPGGDFPVDGVAGLEARLARAAPHLAASTVERLVAAYGTDALRIAEDLGSDLGHGLHAGELRWMIEREWARTVEDVLWRRSKLGLAYSADEVAALRATMAGLIGTPGRAAAGPATAPG